MLGRWQARLAHKARPHKKRPAAKRVFLFLSFVFTMQAIFLRIRFHSSLEASGLDPQDQDSADTDRLEHLEL
jgi:hypothetical protein